jgi:hypothetical protein
LSAASKGRVPVVPMWDHSAMRPEDSEQYTRDLERGSGQTPGAAPQPFGTDSGSPSVRRRFRGVAKLLVATPPGRFILAMVATMVLAVVVFFGALFLHGGPHHFVTTVHGNLENTDMGATATIACNDGILKLIGDNNTDTITGHCRSLDVIGRANHVTVDSADTISVSGVDNAMIYRTGSPIINKTGNNNTVSQG